MSDLYASWDYMKKLLRDDIGEALFKTWIEPLKIKGFSSHDNVLTLAAADRLIYKSVQKFNPKILDAAKEVFNCPEIKVDIVLENKAAKNYVKDDDTHSVTSKYRFENFIEGESNRLAYSASLAVAKNPGEDDRMNPLFIYGDSGLGKTHLMYAIKNEITSTLPEKSVLYVSCEQFVNDLIDGISNKKTGNFRDKYRVVDVLLIDDIQFIIDKDKTQVEVFNTFNELMSSGNQIIFSSDCPPQELKKLPSRLTTRLGSGFVVDVQPPEYETRRAIIERKSRDKGIEFPKEVSEYIAENIKSNIRQLENAVNQVLIYAKFDERLPDLETAKRALKNLITPEEKPVLSYDNIKEKVAEYYSITVDDLNSKRRPNKIAKPRQIAMYLCKKLIPESTYKGIGDSFGNRDHTTVIFAENQIKDTIKENPNIAADIEAIEKRIVS